LIVKQVGVSNDWHIQQSQAIAFNEQMETQYAFTQTEGLKINEKIILRERLPRISDAKFEVGPSFPSEWTSGKLEKIDYLFSAVCPVLVPPHCKVSGRAKCIQTTIEVPWSATVSFHGLSTTKRIGGMWNGTILHDIAYCIEQPKLIPPPQSKDQIPLKEPKEQIPAKDQVVPKDHVVPKDQVVPKEQIPSKGQSSPPKEGSPRDDSQ